MEISQLCRSCMKELLMWENDNIDYRILEMFYYCTNIKILDDEKLPKQFCNDCIIRLESSFAYITEAQKANVTLRNIISRTENSVIVEPENYNNRILADKNYADNINITPSSDANFNEQTLDNVTSEMDRHIDTSEFPKTFEEANITNTECDDTLKKSNRTVNDINNTEGTKKNICPVCRKTFTSKTWFSKHMEKEHTGQKYTCNYCEKTFAKPSQLKCHLISHSDERKFACGTCGKRFKCNKQLSVHMRSHNDARPYACDKCNMRFKKCNILKCHMKVHENHKPFLCSFCGWSFAQAGNLEVHIRRHTGEKPYFCGECGFRAAAASNLRRHQRAHTRATHHICHTCGKGFCDASSLCRHSRTHTGERPYMCAWCPRSFADSWKRKLHLMRAHSLALHDVPRMRRDGQIIQ
ncbi:unnamed protein product [Diatraea saccharalis]|uniref:Uncharacterized protein n=1 Tax=Diatraea saccharalis TaxID=40085 RepID=A0A9N9W6T6_9NEOP|nr:unnamed protein product [Diatraea saccharalis]